MCGQPKGALKQKSGINLVRMGKGTRTCMRNGTTSTKTGHQNIGIVIIMTIAPKHIAFLHFTRMQKNKGNHQPILKMDFLLKQHLTRFCNPPPLLLWLLLFLNASSVPSDHKLFWPHNSKQCYSIAEHNKTPEKQALHSESRHTSVPSPFRFLFSSSPNRQNCHQQHYRGHSSIVFFFPNERLEITNDCLKIADHPPLTCVSFSSVICI